MDIDAKKLQDQFERALIDVLESDYDLAVRRSEDSLERRRQGLACLTFAWPRGLCAGQGKVVVSIEGSRDITWILDVDLGSADAIEDSASDCESLVLGLSGYLSELKERRALETAASRGPARRWDD
ncbi:MAG: hypothetical protein ACE5IL_10670 [Myxococcota bacterium]